MMRPPSYFFTLATKPSLSPALKTHSYALAHKESHQPWHPGTEYFPGPATRQAEHPHHPSTTEQTRTAHTASPSTQHQQHSSLQPSYQPELSTSPHSSPQRRSLARRIFGYLRRRPQHQPSTPTHMEHGKQELNTLNSRDFFIM